MADAVVRDILLRIRASEDLGALQAAVGQLTAMQKALAGVATAPTTQGMVPGIKMAGDAMQDATRRADAHARSLLEIQNAADRATRGETQLGTEIKRVTREVNEQLRSTATTYAGLPGVKATETVFEPVGKKAGRVALTTTEDLRAAERERAVAQKASMQDLNDWSRNATEKVNIQRQMDAAEESLAVKARARISQTAKANAAAVEVDQSAAIGLERNRTKAINAGQKLLAQEEAAAVKAQTIAKQRAAFTDIAAQPGRKTIQDQLGNLHVYDAHNNRLAAWNAQNQRLTVTQAGINSELARTGDTLGSAMQKVALWTIATGLIYGAVRGIKGAFESFAEIEKWQNALSRTGRGFGETQAQMTAGSRAVTDEILRQAVAFGVDASEAQQAAVTFSRLGLSQKETVEATKVAMLASNVAFIGVGEAAQFLTSAMLQFKLSASDLPGILDKLNTLENTTRVRTMDMMAAISRAGSVTREAGGSLEWLTATTAAVAQSTGRSGSEIGTALRTIITRMGDATNQAKIFALTGIEIQDVAGNLKPINDILGEMAVKWITLTDAEKAALSMTVAGTRQRNVLTNALDQYLVVQQQVVRQLTQQGSAQAENVIVMTEMAKKIEQLAAAFKALAYSVIGSGIGTVFKVLLDAMTGFVSLLAQMGTVGALFVTALTAYVTIMALAGLKTMIFGTSLAGLTGPIVRLNAWLAGLTGGMNAYAAATVRATQAQAGLAVAGGMAGGATAGKAGIAAGALGFLSSPLVAAGASAGAVFAGVDIAAYMAGAGTKVRELEGERKKADAIAGTVKELEKQAQAHVEIAKTAEWAASVFNEMEAKTRSGVQLTNNDLAQRKAILDALAGMPLSEIAKKQLAGGTFGAKEMAEEAARQRELKKADDAERVRALERTIEGIKNVIRVTEEAQRKLHELDRRSTDAWNWIPTVWGARAAKAAWGTYAAPEKDTWESPSNRMQANREAIKDASAELEKYNDELNRLRKDTAAEAVAEASKKAFDGLQAAIKKAKDELLDLTEALTQNTERAKIWDKVYATTGIMKADAEIRQLNLDLENQRQILAKMEADRARNPALVDAEDIERQQKKVRDALRKSELAPEMRGAAQVEQWMRIDEARLDAEMKVRAHAAEIAAAMWLPEKDRWKEEVARAKAAMEQIAREQEDIDNRLKGKRGDQYDMERSILEKKREDLGIEAVRARQRYEIAVLDSLKKQTDEIEKQKKSVAEMLGQMTPTDRMKSVIMAAAIAKGEMKPLSMQDLITGPESLTKIYGGVHKLFPGMAPMPQFGREFMPDWAYREGGTASETPAMHQMLHAQETGRTFTEMAGRPSGGQNYMVRVEGLEVPAERLAQGIALEVRAQIEDLMNEKAESVGRVIRRPAKAAVRSR